MCARITTVSRHVATSEGGFQAAASDDERFHLIQGDTAMREGDYIPVVPTDKWKVASFDTLAKLQNDWHQWIDTLVQDDDHSAAAEMRTAIVAFSEMKPRVRRPVQIDRFVL
jgi:hypothetical protein